jgi:hypothetical protein
MSYQNLYQFCTPRQLEVLKAVEQAGSVRAAAKILGLSRGTAMSAVEGVKRKAAQVGRQNSGQPIVPPTLFVPTGPEANEPIEDLLARSEEAWDEVAGMLTDMQGADAKRALDILEKAMAGQKATNKNAKFVADFIRKMRAPAIVGAEGANQSLRYNPETGETE